MADKKMTAAEKKAAAEAAVQIETDRKATERKRLIGAGAVLAAIALFVGGYAIFLIVLVARAHDRASFHEFFDALLGPWSILLHAVTLAMVLFHTVTWLNRTPKVLVIWRGEHRVGPLVIAGAHYAAWLAASVVVAWLALAS